MKRGTRRITAVLAGAITLVAAAAWLAWPDLLEPTNLEETPLPTAAADIAAGEYLARAGNCVACHTVPGDPPMTGGRAIGTPFGDVYSTNLTPDPETGLGRWTTADFWRALHHGRSKDGRRLYPAFPYTNYTLLSREDSDALFAYLRSLEPMHKPRVAPDLRFPYNSGLALRVWRALFFRPGEFEPAPQRTAQWNRGAYLVEGAGHCNACHTPRGRLGALDADAAYAGGDVPGLGWEAPPLNAGGPLNDEAVGEMAALLSTGISERAAVSGPMAEVVFHSLQYLHSEDIEAIVEYVRTLPVREQSALRLARVSEVRRQELSSAGAALYAEHCADCHGARGEGKPGAYPALARNLLVTSPSPSNLIRNVLYGGFPPSTAGNPRPHGMPPYSHQLRDAELAAVLTYVRGAFGNRASAVTPGEIAGY